MHCEPNFLKVAVPYEFGVEYAAVLIATFVRTGVEHAPNIIHAVYSSTYGQRNENFSGNLFHHMHNGIPVIRTRVDIEKSDLPAPSHCSGAPPQPDLGIP